MIPGNLISEMILLEHTIPSVTEIMTFTSEAIFCAADMYINFVLSYMPDGHAALQP